MGKTWIIEQDVFHENEHSLEACVESIYWVRPTIKGLYHDDNLVEIKDLPQGIFYGSIQLGRQIYKKRKDITTWLEDNLYDCNKYMPHLGDLCLNHKHIYMTKYHLEKFHKEIFTEPFFVKENSGYKNFSGHVFSHISELCCFPEGLLLLSAVRQLESEWRVVVSDRVVTAAPYSEDKTPLEGFEDFIWACLERLEYYDAPPLFTIDVTRSEGELKVVEINSLLSAGWYGGDVGKIVKEVETAVGC